MSDWIDDIIDNRTAFFPFTREEFERFKSMANSKKRIDEACKERMKIINGRLAARRKAERGQKRVRSQVV